MDCDIEKIVKEYFCDFSKRKNIPLYMTLRECIKKFIDENPSGTVFPPERKLADTLKINRRTLRRAMDTFKDVLIRGPLGSIVKKMGADEFDFDQLHPQLLANINPYKTAKKTCLLGIYENLPGQQKFWTEAVDEFNKKNANTRIELRFISMNVPNFHDYVIDNLKSSKDFDAIQLQALSLYSPETFALMTPNSQEFTNELFSDAYSLKKVFRYLPDILSKILPVYMNVEIQLIEESILEPNDVELFKLLMAKNPSAAWTMAIDKLPADTYISIHTDDIARHIGFPWPPSDEKLDIRLTEEFTIMQIMSNRGKKNALAMSFESRWFPQERIKKILSEKVFSAYCPFIFTNIVKNRKKSFKILLNGRNIQDMPCLGGEIALGISAGCIERALFEDFARFLLSEPMQRKIICEINALPFNHKAADELRNHASIVGDFTESYSKYVVFHPDMANLYFNINLQMLRRDVCTGLLSVKDAVAKAKSYYK